MNTRVVITGIGVKSPLGSTPDECFQNIASGKRCVDHIENFNTSGFPMTAAGEVRSGGEIVKTGPEIDRKNYFLEEALTDLKSYTQFDKRYKPSEIVLNTGGGIDYVDIESFYRKKEFLPETPSPLSSHYQSNRLINEIAARHRIEGGCNLFVAACVASTQAIGVSYRMIKKGLKRAAIAGGSDSMINYVNYIGFYHLGAMASGSDAPYACRPFDVNRNGTVLGEGALLMLLEDEANAVKEHVLAEITGYATTMDAYAITDPDPSANSLAAAIKNAIKNASISPGEIDCVHLHGTGTPKNAPAEYKALYQVFGDRAKELPVFSLKGQIGHLIGSCGAVEMLGVLHSIKEQVVMPTVNFRDSDPEAPLYVIKGDPLHIPVNYVLKVNSSFGGENTAIVIKRYS